MEGPFKSLEFWIAVAVAVIVKVRTSERLSLPQVCATVAVAVGAAYVAAGWVSEMLGTGEALAAALVALTAEGLMRWVIAALNDPREAIRLWREWRK